MTNKKIWTAILTTAMLTGCAQSSSEIVISTDTDVAYTVATIDKSTEVIKPTDAEENRVIITSDFIIDTSSGEYLINDDTYTITKGGEYLISGRLDGNLVIDVSDDEKVELMLGGVSISCSDNAPIIILNGKKVTITAKGGGFNEILDLREKLDENADEEDNKAAVYSCIDTELKGEGTLYVSAKHNNGVHTKKDLEIKNLTLKVEAVNNALKGNNSVTIESGDITLISSEGDGIKTKNAEINEKGNQKGNITVLGGNISIDTGDDAINAAYDTIISGGNITISTEYKGKGIHADNQLQIDDGNIDITRSYEGLEAKSVLINGGYIKLYATDDGINGSDGAAQTGGFRGQTGNATVTVNGGYVDIETATGDTDGIDVNGSFYQTGGTVIVKGGAATGNMAGSIDVDGSINITGGTTIALGGICEAPSESCNSYFMYGVSFDAGNYTISGNDGDIISFDLDNSFRGGWICSDKLTLGEEYSIVYNGSELTKWTQESGNQGVSNQGGFGQGGFGQGGFGGGKGDKPFDQGHRGEGQGERPGFGDNKPQEQTWGKERL